MPAAGLRRSTCSRSRHPAVARAARAAALGARPSSRSSRALGHCVRVLRRERPAVVVGVGGYASVPCVLAARLLRLPIVVHEQNAVPGSRTASRCGSAPGPRSRSRAPRWPRAVVTGNPIRADVAAAALGAGRRRRCSRVVGGSHGAGRLNDAALDLYDRWRARADVAVRHVAGPKHDDDCRTPARRAAPARRPPRVRARRLRGPTCRRSTRDARSCCAGPGATTVAEVAAVGVPSVLVPWSGAADDQQDDNAGALVAAGAARGGRRRRVHGGDRRADRGRGCSAIPTGRAAMATAARTLGRPDAAAACARWSRSAPVPAPEPAHRPLATAPHPRRRRRRRGHERVHRDPRRDRPPGQRLGRARARPARPAPAARRRVPGPAARRERRRPSSTRS